jgi:hypothetical protein
MVRLGQGCTPIRGKLTSLGCGGSRNSLFYLNCCGGRQNIKRPLQWGFMVEHSISLPKQHPLVIRTWFICVGVVRLNKESLSYSVIDF